MPLKSLNNVVAVELIGNGIKYCISVTKIGPTRFFLVMNGSQKIVNVLRLRSAGLLITFDGNSHTTYLQTEVDK